jgi:hypothetical protein
MYTEGFEGLEAEREQPRRVYGSSSEIDRLIRENNKLKESLEKEKFFNKLLDQEIQELKTTIPGQRATYTSDYWSGGKKVSRGAFYTLLFFSLLMAAYIGYGIYYDKKFSYLKNLTPVSTVPVSTATPENTTADNRTANVNEQPKNTPPAAAVKDSVPTIIGDNKPVTQSQPGTAAAERKKPATQPAAARADDEYDEEEVNAVIDAPITRTNTSTASTRRTPPQSAPSTRTTPPPAAPANKSVIATYKVTSKANFYNSPDENTMRGTFISAGDKTVEALEDRNGFIYVEYTNDLGFTSKGWLSKTDLTKE